MRGEPETSRRWPETTRATVQPFGVPLELLVAILVGAALRLYRLGDESLWLDEAITVSVVRELSWSELLTQFPLVDPHPPLYYATVRLWITVGGASEWAVRFPSVLAGVATIPLLYALTTRLFDRFTAALAAAFFAVAPFQIWYAQEARMYALAVFFGVASFYTLVCVLETDSKRWLGGYILSTALFGYTHVFALFVIGAQTSFLAWHSTRHWLRRDVDSPTPSAVRDEGVGSDSRGGRNDRPALSVPVTQWVGAQAAIIGLLSPWLAVLGWRTFLAGGEGVSIVDWIPRPSPEHVWQLYTLFTFGYADGDVPYWSLSAPPRLLLGVATLCLLFAVVRSSFLTPAEAVQSAGQSGRKATPSGGHDPTDERDTTEIRKVLVDRDWTAVTLLLLWVLVPVVIAVVVSLALTPVFVHRNLIVAAPAVLVLLSRGVRAVPSLPLRYLVAVLLITGMVVPLPGYYTGEQKEQWNDAAAYVEESATPDDVVLVTPAYLEYPFLYYFDEDRVSVRGISQDVSPDDLERQLQDRETIYVVTAAHISERERNTVLQRVETVSGASVTDSREFNTVFVFRLEAQPTRS